MCTVTYIPKSESGFFLTSNRDEAPSRAVKRLSRKPLKGGVELIFPKDPKAGGTWMAVSSEGRAVCLLNGAFEKHRHQPPYRMSRGLMVLEYFQFPEASAFFSNFTFGGMEPFTMIICEGEVLWEVRWDGQRLHRLKPDPTRGHIWSSSPLYPEPVRVRREVLFQEWRQRYPHPHHSEILEFHRSGRVGDPDYDFVMNRNNVVRTVSISSVQVGSEQAEFRYFDLLDGEGHSPELGQVRLQR